MSMIFTDIDYAKDGKQVGFLYLPHSVTRSAYGNVAIPIACIKNGVGPTALLMAGTHGDEYEGQVALADFIRECDPAAFRGRVIVLPMANQPAAAAGLRLSPIDDGNLFRAFPGARDGRPTSQIAHYIDTVLFPMADFHFDMHSGGASLDYVPIVAVARSSDADLDARSIATLRAINPPVGQIWNHFTQPRFLIAAAIARGCVSINAELGGGGRISPAGMALARRSIRNLLIHAGIMAGAADVGPPTRLVEVWGREAYVYAPDRGLFEPYCELGDMVTPVQECGRLVFIDEPMRAPITCRFPAGGLLVCKRHPGPVERGDCLAHLARDVS